MKKSSSARSFLTATDMKQAYSNIYEKPSQEIQ